MSRNHSKLLFLMVLLFTGAALVATNHPWPERQERVFDHALVNSGPSSATSWEAPVVEARAPNQDDEVELSALAALEFREFATRVLHDLPRVKDGEQWQATEAHVAPRALKNAAVQMGRLAELVKENLQFKPIALEFYQDCTIESGLPSSLRALCLNRASQLHVELYKKSWDFDRALVPVSIIDLAQKL